MDPLETVLLRGICFAYSAMLTIEISSVVGAAGTASIIAFIKNEGAYREKRFFVF